MINWRRKSNSVVGLIIDGEWEENTGRVKEEVRSFFQQRFAAATGEGLKLDGVPFLTLSAADNAFLVEQFEPSEIKAAVWACGGDKSQVLMGLTSSLFSLSGSFWRRILQRW